MQNKFTVAAPHYRICKEGEKLLKEKVWIAFIAEIDKQLKARAAQLAE